MILSIMCCRKKKKMGLSFFFFLSFNKALVFIKKKKYFEIMFFQGFKIFILGTFQKAFSSKLYKSILHCYKH